MFFFAFGVGSFVALNKVTYTQDVKRKILTAKQLSSRHLLNNGLSRHSITTDVANSDNSNPYRNGGARYQCLLQKQMYIWYIRQQGSRRA